jgi:hypothetical protein
MIDNVSLTPKKDLSFFHNLPENEIDELFRLLGISDFIISPEVKKEMLFFMNILSWRVTGSDGSGSRKNGSSVQKFR